MDDNTSDNGRDKAKQKPEILRFEDDIGMVDGLTFEEVDRQIALSLRLAECHHRKAAYYLLNVDRRKLYHAADCSSTQHYAEVKRGMERRQFAELLAIGKMLDLLPATDEAFCEQEISWSKVRLLRRILTEDNEAPWLEIAKTSNVRELARRLRLHKKGELPKTPDQMKGTPEVRFSAHLSIDPDTEAKLSASQAKLSAELGRPATVLDVLKASVELYLQMENDGKAPGWTHVRSSLYRVHLYPPPRDDGGCEDKEQEPVREGPLWVGTDVGLVPLDGNEKDGLEAPHRSKMARDDGILVGKGEVVKDQPTPDALRTRVLDRDGGKCRCCNAKIDFTSTTSSCVRREDRQSNTISGRCVVAATH